MKYNNDYMINSIKRFLSQHAEYYLIGVILLSGYSPATLINPIAVGLAAMIGLQIILKNKIAGMMLAILFLLVNVFMFFALISEFNEFPSLNSASLQLLLVGFFIFSVNVTVAVLMIIKYSVPVGSSALKY